MFYCRKQRPTHFLPHRHWMSFVVWPYINNVKVMISRLKPCPVLSAPSLPLDLFLSSSLSHVCGEDGRAAERITVSLRLGEIPGCAVQLSHRFASLITWGKGEGSKDSFWENIALFSISLSFAPEVRSCRMMDGELALWPPMSSPLPLAIVSPYPPPLPPPDIYTHSDTLC